MIVFRNPVERRAGDGIPVYFQWPRSGAEFTYEYSTDGGANFFSGDGVITERNADGKYDYFIPYNVEERPEGAGIVLYLIDDGEDTGRIIVNVAECATSPVPAPSEFGASGPRRVRTKEMEIEQFRPDILQLVEDRKVSKTPSFCQSQFCIGVPATRKLHK